MRVDVGGVAVARVTCTATLSQAARCGRLGYVLLLTPGGELHRLPADTSHSGPQNPRGALIGGVRALASEVRLRWRPFSSSATDSTGTRRQARGSRCAGEIMGAVGERLTRFADWSGQACYPTPRQPLPDVRMFLPF